MVAAAPALSQERADRLVPLARLSVSGQINGKEGGVAQDISGMACILAAGSKTLCVLINDENTSAQFVWPER